LKSPRWQGFLQDRYATGKCWSVLQTLARRLPNGLNELHTCGMSCIPGGPQINAGSKSSHVRLHCFSTVFNVATGKNPESNQSC
jgi:hypothetical protein